MRTSSLRSASSSAQVISATLPRKRVVPPPHRYALHRRRRRSSAPLSPASGWCPHLIATLCIVVGAGHQRHSPPQAGGAPTSSLRSASWTSPDLGGATDCSSTVLGVSYGINEPVLQQHPSVTGPTVGQAEYAAAAGRARISEVPPTAAAPYWGFPTASTNQSYSSIQEPAGSAGPARTREPGGVAAGPAGPPTDPNSDASPAGATSAAVAVQQTRRLRRPRPHPRARRRCRRPRRPPDRPEFRCQSTAIGTDT